MLMKTSFVAAILACLSMTVQAHISMSNPCGRYHSRAGCPAPPPGQSIDYDTNSPIGTHDSQKFPLCKHTVPYTQRTVYKAGETINTGYSIGAAHGGGHCQWALSYDNGKTYVVIKTLLGECFKGQTGGQSYTLPVQIPSNAPSGKATFMWLWNNAVGNRELYSSCADIEIKGSNGGSISGVEPLIANYGPSSVFIAEFVHGNDGSGEFAKRKPITISVPSGNGASEATTTTTQVIPIPTTTTTTSNTAWATCSLTTTTRVVTRTETEVIKPTWCI